MVCDGIFCYLFILAVDLDLDMLLDLEFDPLFLLSREVLDFFFDLVFLVYSL